MKAVRVLVLTGYGLNCDHETTFAFEQAGAKPDRVHINALIDESVDMLDYQILVLGGGFGWGDDHGAGVVQAVRMKNRLGGKLAAFVAAGNLVLGICNGFQVLVNLGLLPGFESCQGRRQAALTYNDCGNFRDQWVHLTAAPDCPCVFTRGFHTLELPVRHGEGKFYAEPRVIQQLCENGQVVLRYALASGQPAGGRFPQNPNGSLDDIAGICDPTGRIFGLMPHPEAYNHYTNHPDWMRIAARARRRGRSDSQGLTPGVALLKNAVDFFQ
jgi:phosphoribosylformylglycinamidine synthase